MLSDFNRIPSLYVLREKHSPKMQLKILKTLFRAKKFVLILGRNASWFPNVVAYCSRKFGTKRADLISLFADALILPTGDTRTGVFFILFQFFFLLIFSKGLTRNEKRCVTCASKQLNNINFGFSETWLSPRSIWRCCVTTVLNKEKRIPNF